MIVGGDDQLAQLVNERRERFFGAYMAKVRESTPIEIKTEVLRRVLAATGL